MTPNNETQENSNFMRRGIKDQKNFFVFNDIKHFDAMIGLK